MRKLRILVGKPGLDGHDRGAKIVARALRDAGHEVIYTGLHQTPEMIVAAAIQEDVDAIGLSILSGAHMTLLPRIAELLREKGAGDIALFGGGVIPDEDVVKLKTLGIDEIFTPGAPLKDIIDYVARRFPHAVIMFEHSPKEVTVYEVGPRDGLQNESAPVPTTAKIAFIAALVQAGLKRIEATSFVHPKWIPQLADADQVCAGLPEGKSVRFSALVPNLKGLDRALKTRIDDVAIFLSASETHNQKNIHRTVDESLSEYVEVVRAAKAAGKGVRGYVSTVFGCPYEGQVAVSQVRRVIEALLAMGVDEISLGDTIGVATPGDVYRISRELLSAYPGKSIALHLHNTRGTALANVLSGLEAGVRTFDSTGGGLGGCPYAPGASGNLSTEDLVYMLHGLGIHTGIDLMALTRATLALQPLIGHSLESNVARSLSYAVQSDEPQDTPTLFIPRA